MDNPKGFVVSVSAETDPVRVQLDVDATVACPRCAAGQGCGAGLLGQRPQRRRIEAALTDGIDVKAGDSVHIELRPRNVLLAAAIVYGYPLFAAVLAATVAWGLGLDDRLAAVFSLVGLAAGYLLAKHRLGDDACLRQLTPVIVERLPETATQ